MCAKVEINKGVAKGLCVFLATTNRSKIGRETTKGNSPLPTATQKWPRRLNELSVIRVKQSRNDVNVVRYR